MKITLLFIFGSAYLNAQELHQTDYEKGYLKEGKKYSVWQYFNSNKEVELAINHSTGKVMYTIPDSSAYIILKNGEWISSRLDVHPIPITGYYNFYRAILDTLKYPAKGFKDGLEGKVVATFDVDTLGLTTNYAIIKSIGGSCDSAVIEAFKTIEPKWIPARAGNKRYPTKFAISLRFRLFQDKSLWEHEDFIVDPKKARLLGDFVVKASLDSDRFTSNAGLDSNDGKVFTFVEQSAEFVGGLEGFYKWLQKNLRYPVSTKRLGLEGKVFVKFIIEPTGAISNVEVVKGFNGECDKEAIRVMSIMPKWKPGRQSGKAVRQSYQLPITFRKE